MNSRRIQDHGAVDVLSLLALSACFVLLFLISFSLRGGVFPVAELDSSWQTVMGFANKNRLQFGTDVVFTAGPLGYLSLPYGLGTSLSSHLVFALLFSAYTALAGTILVRDLQGLARLPFFVVLAIYPVGGDPTFVFLVIVFAGFYVITHRTLWAELALVPWLCVLALVKFTYGVGALAVIIAAVVLRVAGRDTAGAGRLAILSVAAFLGMWMLAGQALGNLPTYLTTGLEISMGYSGAMSVSPPPRVLAYALLALGLFAVALILVLRTAWPDPVATTLLAQVSMITFITWKQGFVRADGAVVFLSFLPVAFGLLFHRLVTRTLSRSTRRVLLAGYLALTACVLLAVDAIYPGAPVTLAQTLPQRLGDRARLLLRAIAHDSGTERATLKGDPRARAGDILPRISDQIGDQTVDVFHYRQAVAIINDLNYRPRPVIQSYSAYTPTLQNLNLAFYRSEARPRYVLLDWGTIDNRLPTLDDAPTLTYVLNNYAPVLWEGKFLLLEHLTSGGESPQYHLAYKTRLPFGQTLNVSRWTAGPLFMRARIDPSLIGRIKTLLYQPSPIILDGDYDGVGRRSFRFVPAMGHAKFLVSPLLEDNSDIVDLWTGENGRRLRSIAFRVPGSRFMEYAEPIEIEVYESPDFLRRIRLSSTLREQLRAGRYPMFPVAPLLVQSPIRSGAVDFGGTIGLLVHAPGAVVLPVPPQARGLAGVFGLLEGAYRDGGQTDGVEFSIEIKDVEGKIRRAFVRMVRPREKAEDRGRLAFAIALQSGRDREVVLRTHPGSSAAWDWSVWSDLRFE